MSFLTTVIDYTQRAVGLPGQPDLYRHRLPLLDGGELAFASRAGRPTLVVNTASQCGFASQHHGLQRLHESYGEAGLIVLGCPSADFGGREFEDPEEISLFSRGLFETDFPLTQPMAVRFEPHPFWQDLAGLPNSGPPVWNFTKYLVGAHGDVLGWWSANVRPESPRIARAIEDALAPA